MGSANAGFVVIDTLNFGGSVEVEETPVFEYKTIDTLSFGGSLVVVSSESGSPASENSFLVNSTNSLKKKLLVLGEI